MRNDVLIVRKWNSLLTFVRKRIPPKNPSDFRRWLQVKDLQQQKSVFLIERGNNEGIEFDGCKKEWTLGTPVSIVRMIKKRG